MNLRVAAMTRRLLGITLALTLATTSAFAQQLPPAPGWAQPPLPPQTTVGYPTPSSSRSGRASSFEMGTLYIASAAYGVGLGIWLDAELELEDPGILLIPPTLLGVAAPVGALLLNRPPLPRGVPGAIAAGM